MTNVSSRYVFNSTWYEKQNKTTKEIQIVQNDTVQKTVANNSNISCDNTLSSNEVINFLEMSCENYPNKSSIFSLKFTDKKGKVVMDAIDYSSLVEKNNNSPIITGDKNSKQEKVRAMLEELKSQYKEVAKRAVAPVVVKEGASRPSLLDVIDFDDVYSKTVEKFLSGLDDAATTISRIVDDFGKMLSQAISAASKGYVGGVYKPSENPNNKVGVRTSSTFSLKFSDKDKLPVEGSINYESIIENNNSQYISGKENVKSLLEKLKPQYKEIAQKAIVPSIVREGAKRPTLLDKIDFDDVYSKTVEKFLSGLNDNAMLISKVVDDFSMALTLAISIASKGDVNGEFGRPNGRYHK